MSIRLEVAYRDLLKRVENLEKQLAGGVTETVTPNAPAPKGKLTPKHMHFGKWGLVDETGAFVDKGPYSKEAAHKAAELAA